MNTNQSSLVHSTSTDDPYLPEVWEDDYFAQDDPHCFVCGRHTDHFAEHDALVEAGLATYADDGSVYRTARYDAEQAAEIAEAEYAVYDSLRGEAF